MHMRTELASVVAAVLRYRSGTWTPRLKPAVRAACGGERAGRSLQTGASARGLAEVAKVKVTAGASKGEIQNFGYKKA